MIKGLARKTSYIIKRKNEVQKIVLEASRDDDDYITESEFMTVAHLCYNSKCLISIKKTLRKRFQRIGEAVVCCKKALQILDFCIKYGPQVMRTETLQEISELKNITQSFVHQSTKPRDYLDTTPS